MYDYLSAGTQFFHSAQSHNATVTQIIIEESMKLMEQLKQLKATKCNLIQLNATQCKTK